VSRLVGSEMCIRDRHQSAGNKILHDCPLRRPRMVIL
jgi:hypothetical protein